MDKTKNRLWRLEELSFLLLEIRKSGRITLYNKPWFINFILVIFIGQLIKDLYFSFTSLTVEYGLLYGNMLVSPKSDQRLFNFVLVASIGMSILYFYFYIFKNQRLNHYKLSDFLIVTDIDQFCIKFNVRKSFAKDYFKELDKLARLNSLYVISYEVLTFSFYVSGIVQLINLEISFGKILKVTVPSIILGSLSFCIYYKMALSSYTFWLLYVKLMIGRVNKLSYELNILSSRHFNDEKILSNHLFYLNRLLKEFKISQNYLKNSKYRNARINC